MKSRNLEQAFKCYAEFEVALRSAHADAVDAKDGFAEILINKVLEKSSRTHWLLNRMKEAATK
jgi:hypothetical protein